MAYLYLHTRLDTNDIFYIGISANDNDNFSRAYNKKYRSKFWKNITNKTEYRVDIVYRNISKEKAIELEIKLISLYGRRELGKGNLVNMTDGGEGGGRGRKISEETKLKTSESCKIKLNTPEVKLKMSEKRKTWKYSDESKLKMSESKKGPKNGMFGKTPWNKKIKEDKNDLV